MSSNLEIAQIKMTVFANSQVSSRQLSAEVIPSDFVSGPEVHTHTGRGLSFTQCVLGFLIKTHIASPCQA